MNFSIANQNVSMSKASVERALQDVDPEPIQVHSVTICGTSFPVVQALEIASGIPRFATRSARARTVFSQLGFILAENRSSN